MRRNVRRLSWTTSRDFHFGKFTDFQLELTGFEAQQTTTKPFFLILIVMKNFERSVIKIEVDLNK